ncbi:MAG TPA: acyl-CoA desaturase [Myxococcota bacterium]|jgi:stearoyl-CoA desaturase (delta-9 desaturase)|nr:acyl-CoA desaturase [Myxococcota bacterium]
MSTTVEPVVPVLPIPVAATAAPAVAAVAVTHVLPREPAPGDDDLGEADGLEPFVPPVETDVLRRGYDYLGMIPFVLTHVLILGAIWSGVTWQAVACGAVLFWGRMFAITAGYHRYFAHRTYKTSRPFQFVLAFLSMTSSQKGVLWWAAHHRDHHKYSDGPKDVHSPVQRGFWYSHFGWLYDNTADTKWDRIRDMARYPELRWLNKHWLVPPVMTGVATFLLFGWPGLFIGFFASTVLLWHATFTVNSLAHVFGKRHYDTSDDSRNSMLIALLTFGEGWHNNHHHYMLSTRQGFRWWQIDITYYILKGLSWVGLVWDLREPPREVVASANLAGLGRSPALPPVGARRHRTA